MATTEQSKKGLGRIYYGWWLVLGAATLAAFNSSLFLASFAVYIVHMERTLGWSRTVLTGAYSMSRSQSGFLAPAEGWLVDKIGPRATMRIGAVLLSAGLIGLSQVHHVAVYYAIFFLMALGSALMVQITVITTIGRWFVRNRTKAIAFSLTGSSIGGFIGVPIVALAVESFGWRTVTFSAGLIILAVAIPVSSIFRYSPEAHGMRPDGDPVPPGEIVQPAAETQQRRPGRRDRPTSKALPSVRQFTRAHSGLLGWPSLPPQ